MTPPLRRLAFAFVVVATFSYYVAAAAPGPYWLDSSEFAAQAFELGVAHPPGHPLFGLLGKAATLVPLGSVAFRVSLAAALCAALGAGLLLLITLDLARRVDSAVTDGAGPGELPRTAVAVAATLFVACGYSYAFQAVRPEVYALHALCAFLTVYALLRHDASGERRWLYLAAFVGALGLGNHHLLMASVLVPGFLVALVRRWGGLRPALRAVGRAAGFAALGLAVWLYLPLRAARAPEVNWGDARTPARFVWTVSARAFSGRSLERARDPAYAGAPAGMLRLGGRQLGPLGILGLVGLVALGRRREGRRAAALLGGVTVAGAVATWAVGFDATNPDVHGYLGVPLGLLAAAGGAGLAALATAAARAAPRAARLTRAGSVALLALPLVQAVGTFPEVDLRGARGCETITRAVLDAVPPRGTLLTAYFQTVFGVWYARGVEGARPDITHAHLGFLRSPGYAAALARRYPELHVPPDGVQAASAAVLGRLAERAPVALQLDLTTRPDALGLLASDGLLTRVVLDPAARAALRAGAAARQQAFFRALRLRLGEDVDEPQTARVLLYGAYLETRFHCAVGSAPAAAAAFARAHAIAPDDPLLLETGRRCGLRPVAADGRGGAAAP